MHSPTRRWLLTTAALIAAGYAVGIAAAGRTARASDHQDTPEVELSPRMDVNDVYAFPGANGTDNGRITLVMTTSSPIVPAANAGAKFDHNLLYQFKIDNSGDAVEDLVIQVTFDSTANNGRVVNVRGPAAPPAVMDADGTPLPRGGTASAVMRNASIPSLVGGATEQVLSLNTSAGPIQLFAGLRDDPFFIDLEQTFRILPDRKPVSGPLAALPETPSATAFRGAAAPFDVSRGAPVDILTAIKANTLAIVVELPVSLLAPGANKKIGVWGTISR